MSHHFVLCMLRMPQYFRENIVKINWKNIGLNKLIYMYIFIDIYLDLVLYSYRSGQNKKKNSNKKAFKDS